MEGVMMRSPHSYCVAVRKANGEIVTQESPLGAAFRPLSDFQTTRAPRLRHARVRRCGWA